MKITHEAAKQKRQTQNEKAREPRRTIGFDNHPDSFTAAFLVGNDAASARVIKTQDHLPQEQLEPWIEEHTTPADVVVMEASANSFETAKVLRKHGRRVVIMESQRCGQIGDAYRATDRVDAIKLARIHLSGLARQVWVPDATTRMRREVFYAYNQAVKDATRARQRLRGFLNQYRIRLPKGFKITAQNALEKLLALRSWEPTQRLLLSQQHRALREAHQRRMELKEVMAAELLKEPAILRLIRLCGLRHITAFALAAFIGDVTRFASAKRLVAYIGLNPGVCNSGETRGGTHLRNNGCAPLRALMVQAAQVIMRMPGAAFAKWGRQLMLRRGRNRATVGVARKLVTAVWYCLSGQFTALEEVPQNVETKLKLLIGALGTLSKEILGDAPLGEYVQSRIEILKKSHTLLFQACH